MNFKTNLLKDYVIFVFSTFKQSTYFKTLIALFVIIVYLLFFTFI